MIVTIFTSALATCMAGALTPESAQMACCSMGHEACEHAGSAMDCCKKTAPQPQQLFVAKTDPFSAPLRHVLVS